MNTELPEDTLSIALTKTPLVRYLKVPMTYAMVIAIAGMVPFFVTQMAGASYFKSVFIAAMVAIAIWLIGAEITRRDDRQLEILWHYFITRGVLNFVYRLINLIRRNRPFYKGDWCDL